MTISFQCTGCDRTLKVADELAGRKAKCPKCQTVLVIPEGEASAVIEAPPPKPKKKVAAAPPPEETLEELNAPEPEREERPAGRGRKKGKKSLLLPMLVIGGGLLVVLCSGVIGLGVWWFLANNNSNDDYYFLPDNTQIVGAVHMDQLLSSGALQQVRTEFPDFNQQMIKAGSQSAAIDTATLDRMLIGGQMPAGGTGPPNFVVILRTKQPVKAPDVEAGMKKDHPDLTFTEVKVGRYTMYEGKSSNPTPIQPALSFTMPDDRRVVSATAEVLRAVLTRDKKPEISDKLQAAMNQTDFNATVAFAANAKEAFARQAALPGGMGRPGAPANPFEKVDGLSVTANVGADVAVKVTALCPDAASAGEVHDNVKKALDGYRNLLSLMGNKTPPEVADLLNIDPQVSGSTVTASKTIPVAPLIKYAKAQQAPPVFIPQPGKRP